MGTMTFRRKDARSIVITISASCERNMVGTVSKQFLKECMENEETGMTDLRIEIEKQEEKDPMTCKECGCESWMEVDNLNVERVMAKIYTDESYDPYNRQEEEWKPSKH